MGEKSFGDGQVFRALPNKKIKATTGLSYLAAALYIGVAGTLIGSLVCMTKSNVKASVICAVLAVVIILALLIMRTVIAWEIDPKFELRSDGYWYSYRLAVNNTMGEPDYKVHFYTITDVKCRENKLILHGDMDIIEGRDKRCADFVVIKEKFPDELLPLLKDCCFERASNKDEDEYDDISEEQLSKAEESVRKG